MIYGILQTKPNPFFRERILSDIRVAMKNFLQTITDQSELKLTLLASVPDVIEQLIL